MAHITALNYFTVRITLLVCVHCVVFLAFYRAEITKINGHIASEIYGGVLHSLEEIKSTLFF